MTIITTIIVTQLLHFHFFNFDTHHQHHHETNVMDESTKQPAPFEIGTSNHVAHGSWRLRCRSCNRPWNSYWMTSRNQDVLDVQVFLERRSPPHTQQNVPPKKKIVNQNSDALSKCRFKSLERLVTVFGLVYREHIKRKMHR